MTRDVEEVLEVLVPCAKQGPDRTGAFVDVSCLPLSSVVTQEGAIKTRVCVLHQLDLHHGQDKTSSQAFKIAFLNTVYGIYSVRQLNTKADSCSRLPSDIKFSLLQS